MKEAQMELAAQAQTVTVIDSIPISRAHLPAIAMPTRTQRQPLQRANTHVDEPP